MCPPLRTNSRPQHTEVGLDLLRGEGPQVGAGRLQGDPLVRLLRQLQVAHLLERGSHTGADEWGGRGKRHHPRGGEGGGGAGRFKFGARLVIPFEGETKQAVTLQKKHKKNCPTQGAEGRELVRHDTTSYLTTANTTLQPHVVHPLC